MNGLHDATVHHVHRKGANFICISNIEISKFAHHLIYIYIYGDSYLYGEDLIHGTKIYQ